MIEFINAFWLFLYEILFPLIGIYLGFRIFILCFKCLREFFERKGAEREKRIADADFLSEIKMPLSKRQVLTAIANRAKKTAIYAYGVDYGEEILLSEYKEFLNELGFK